MSVTWVEGVYLEYVIRPHKVVEVSAIGMTKIPMLEYRVFHDFHLEAQIRVDYICLNPKTKKYLTSLFYMARGEKHSIQMKS